jgi:hypothetical protein
MGGTDPHFVEIKAKSNQVLAQRDTELAKFDDQIAKLDASAKSALDQLVNDPPAQLKQAA